MAAVRGVVGRVYVLVEFEETKTEQGVSQAPKRVPHRIEYEKKFTSGTDDDELNRIWSTDTSQSTTETDVDVQGSLAGVLDSGDTVALAEVCVICLVNDDAIGGDDALLGAGTNPFTGMLASGDIASVKPQGILLWVAPAGVAAAAGVSDIIRIDASANTVDVRALLAGRST